VYSGTGFFKSPRLKVMTGITEAIQKGAPFFSFIIGLGIAALLFHRNYAVLKTLALPLSEIQDRVVKVDGKCYRYRVEDSNCEIPSST
jgi:hypothetical protein